MEKKSHNIGKIIIVSSATWFLLTFGLFSFLKNQPSFFREITVDYQDDTQPYADASQYIYDQEQVDAQIVNVVKEANPAVVSVVVSKDVPVIRQRLRERAPSMFDEFFGYDPFGSQVFPEYYQDGTELQEVGGGSGFFVSSNGMIITNKHVVDDQDASYSVLLPDGSEHNAEVLARDPFLDIAVLKVNGAGFPFLDFATDSSVSLGQTAIAIGNALAEFQNSVSVGVVSGLGRNIEAGNGFGVSERLNQVIQTDAAINPGNSGGPLLNIAGQVIGVNVAVATNGENIGFALPANEVAKVVDSVMQYGEIVRPFVGVRYMAIDAQVQQVNGLPYDYGIVLRRGVLNDELAVVPGSPADIAGLRENDIVLEVDGVKIDDTVDFARLIREYDIEDTIELKTWSRGEEQLIELTLKKAPTL